MKLTKENCKWIVVNGSIFTEPLFEFKAELSQGRIKARKSIAFNVGELIAQHIVNLHNAKIEEK